MDVGSFRDVVEQSRNPGIGGIGTGRIKGDETVELRSDDYHTAGCRAFKEICVKSKWISKMKHSTD